MSTPLSTVKDRFESKEKLVEAVEKLMTEDLWVPRLASDRGGKRGIKHVSNAKLLRLHDTLTEVKEKFGTRAKLIEAVLEVENRSKDSGYKTRLEAYPVPRLYDQYKSSARRAEKKAKKAKSE
jgi:hypothetical protein